MTDDGGAPPDADGPIHTMTRTGRTLRTGAAAVVALALLAAPAAAHTGSLRLGGEPPPVPTWLVVMTGGGVIGMSFLFASLVTDHALVREINGRRGGVTVPSLLRRAARRLARWAGVLVLLGTIGIALVGPRDPTTNAAVLFVWAAWWAGYTATVYLLGNTWPALNPWRTLAAALPRVGERRLPDGLGQWPAVAGLLGLIWLEVVAPVAADPRALAVVVVAYSIATVGGATVFGTDPWFERIDPIARVFACYGRIAPIQRTADGLDLRLPGAAATDGAAGDGTAPAFVVAVLWATTFDGLVSTPAWRAVIDPLVAVGVPALLVYLAAIAVGYGAFLAVYRLGARLVRRTGETYLGRATIADAFAPSLLPIAAGYHLAHFLGYVLSLLPALAVSLRNPLSGVASVPVLVLPDWFGALGLLFILVGHVVAIWVAHSIAFELFPGRLQPLRSQYPLVALMILYTMTSMWIVVQPAAGVPYV